MKKLIIAINVIVFLTLIPVVFAQNYKYAVRGFWRTTLRQGVKMYMAFSKQNELEIIVKYSKGKTKSITRTYSVVGNKIYVKSGHSVLIYTFTILKLNKRVMILENQTKRKYYYTRVNVKHRRGKRHKLPGKQK